MWITLIIPYISDYTNQKNGESLQALFPDLATFPLRLLSSEGLYKP